MKLLVLPFGDRACASTYYRVLQYLDMLKQDDVSCDVMPPGEMPSASVISGYDAVLVQKKLFSSWRVSRLRKHARRLLFDIDDATWHPHGRRHSWLTRWRTNHRLQSIARAADVCLAANQYIADHLTRLGGAAEVVPMAIREQATQPATQPARPGRIRIGWSGAPGNLRYLEALTPVLTEILSAHSQVELAVLCGRAPAFAGSIPYVHLPWHPGAELSAVSTFHLGLLPLPEDCFARGKFPIKALQYMAAGIPTVATPQDGALELARQTRSMLFAATLQEWKSQITELILHHGRREELGREARSTFDHHYSTTQTYPVWKKHLLNA